MRVRTLLATILALAACDTRLPAVPAEIRGVWVPSQPVHEARAFEVTDSLIHFHQGGGAFETAYIRQVRLRVERSQRHFELLLGRHSDDGSFRFSLDAREDQPVVRLPRRPGLRWVRDNNAAVPWRPGERPAGLLEASRPRADR